MKVTEKGTEMSVLYSGPLPDAKVVLPLGTFELMAEVHEEAGAYTKHQIEARFPTYLPDEKDYKAVDLTAMLKRYSEVGDQARVSQILQADASIRAAACWFDLKCSLSQVSMEMQVVMTTHEKVMLRVSYSVAARYNRGRP